MFHRVPVSLTCICLGIGLLGTLGSLLPVLSVAEDNLGLHLLYWWRGPEKSHADVVVVAIDRESARAFNLPAAAHKWPRMLHARLLNRLTASGVAVVAFDLIFHDPQNISDDQALGVAIAEAGNVILTQPIQRRTMSLVDSTGNRAARVNIEMMVSAIPVIADAALDQAPFPLPKIPVKLNQFWRFSPGSGDVPTLPVVAMHVYAMAAFDEFVTRLKKIDPAAADTLPAMADGKSRARRIIDSIRPLYLLFEKDPTLADRMTEDLERHPPPTPLVRALIELYSPGNSRYLNLYGPPGTIETISYHRLLGDNDASFGPEKKELPALGGKAVFVGQTQSDWFKANDGFYTAFTEASGMDISGVEIAATAFANLLEDKAVRPLGPAVNLALLFGWGVAGALITLCLSTAASTAGLLILNGAYIFLAFAQFKSGGTWYPLVVPILVQTPAAFMAGTVWKYRKANRERRNIREAFGHYLPNDVVDKLASNAKNLAAGGQVIYSICLFTDAESYTSLSEELDPESLTRLMNSYYEAIFKPIKDQGGIILQVIGDSVLALWTAAQQSDALKSAAGRAAVGISDAVRQFNAKAAPHLLPTRVGIHAGKILLGNIGTMDHFEYRPVGDIVNTASRLEGLNKYLGTRMLTSEEALGPDNGIVTRPVGQFVFKGKLHPVRAHEILQNSISSPQWQTDVYRTFALGLKAFEMQRWGEAGRYFDQALQIDENDGPSKFYRNLCLELSQRPPGSEWSGAVHLAKK
ncbi:MAG: adenylate/guanylate cyclase domain-containing protein [Desulfobacteraceae bacterium]|jgi:adenylate cyclase